MKGRNRVEKEKLINNYHMLKQSSSNLYKEITLLHTFQKKNKKATSKIIKHYKEKGFLLENSKDNVEKLETFKKSLEIYKVIVKLNMLSRFQPLSIS
jgi:DNA-directed RNA polymerase specialized sigma54-like protein